MYSSNTGIEETSIDASFAFKFSIKVYSKNVILLQFEDFSFKNASHRFTY